MDVASISTGMCLLSSNASRSVVRIALLLGLLLVAAVNSRSAATSSVTGTKTMSATLSPFPASSTASSSNWRSASDGSSTTSGTRSLSAMHGTTSASRSEDNPTRSTSMSFSVERSPSQSVSPSPTASRISPTVLVTSSTSPSWSWSASTSDSAASVSPAHTTSVQPNPSDSATASESDVHTLTLSMSRSPTRSKPSVTKTITESLTISYSLSDVVLEFPWLQTHSMTQSESSSSSTSHEKSGTPTHNETMSEVSPSPTSTRSETPSWSQTCLSSMSETGSKSAPTPSPSSTSPSTVSASHSNSNVPSISTTLSATHAVSESSSISATQSSTAPASLSWSELLTLTLPLPPSKTRSSTPQKTFSPSSSLSSDLTRSNSRDTRSASPSTSRSLGITLSNTSSLTSAATHSISVSAGTDSPSRTEDASFTPTASVTPSSSISPSRITNEASLSATASSTATRDESSSSTQTSSWWTLTEEITTSRSEASPSSSTTKPMSFSPTRVTSRRRVSHTLSLPTPSDARSSSHSATATERLSASQSNSRTDSSSPSGTLTFPRTESPTLSVTNRATSTATYTRTLASPSTTASTARNSTTQVLSSSLGTPSVTATMSSPHTTSPSDAAESPTNYNKSISRSHSFLTITLNVTMTATKRKTLTMTQSLVPDIQLSNALGAYFLAAFDFSDLSNNGPCSGVASTLSLILFLLTAIGGGTVVYRRVVKRERPDVDTALRASVRRVLARENIYAGIFVPCHFHCWWIHCLMLLAHINAIFLLSACILYSFEDRGAGGLLTGTAGLGAVAGIIGGSLPHLMRPLLDAGFFFVTYNPVDRRKCQNEGGLTWERWHENAQQRREALERKQVEAQRAKEEERRQGLHFVCAAMTTNVDENGWGAPVQVPPTQLEHVAVDVGATEKDNSEEIGGNPSCELDPPPMVDIKALRETTLEADLCIDEDAAGATTSVSWEAQSHAALELLRERERRLDAKWATPLSQLWWGPVETHHLLVGTCVVFVVFILMSAYQQAIHNFNASACNSASSPLAVAIVVALVLDVCLFEPLHQCLKLLWRYALEHEGNVDYTTTLARRAAKLITELSEPHPYRGEMKLWPEEALLGGVEMAQYALEGTVNDAP